ncbi:hypothetical protein ACEZDB_04860 [Streptacidiphilus sp. N1-3]|uniref:DUF4276 family protein n=1 Tax=Streptacidiphilus alkalitolerans TaxID=3342712 RepID=A0ABV6WW67_9ACTN
MSERYLTCALMTEGRSDELFLVEVLLRQLQQISLAGSPGFSVGPPLTVELRTIAETASVRAEVGLLLVDFDLVFAHRDHRESAKLDPLRLLPGHGSRLVGLVPRCETEAWTLCDPEAFRTVKGVDLALLPARPKDVERVPDPKKLLREVLGGADAMPVLGRLGRDVRLDRLQQIPAYRAWLAELTRALKELHFL